MEQHTSYVLKTTSQPSHARDLAMMSVCSDSSIAFVSCVNVQPDLSSGCLLAISTNAAVVCKKREPAHCPFTFGFLRLKAAVRAVPYLFQEEQRAPQRQAAVLKQPKIQRYEFRDITLLGVWGSSLLAEWIHQTKSGHSHDIAVQREPQ